MSYQVTARKWRPMVFEDVVGQSHVMQTLRNAIATNRVAHAYIFSGQRGTGKTTTARILAKAINCLSPKDLNPDNSCEICRDITEGRSLNVIEIDGASNRGVEEIRNLRESVRYTPTQGKYKVYIIDEVHMLTKEAFNALLKTLEEPPSHIIFIFATTEVHKVPATILSRCQRFDFRRITVDEITSRLRFIAKAEQIPIEDDALLMIAKKADGSLRDAQSIFDQVRSFCGNTISISDVQSVLKVLDQEIFFRVTDLIKAKDTRGGIELVEEIMRNGHDLREFLIGLTEHFRNLLIALTTGSTKLLETSEFYKQRYQVEAQRFSEDDILRLIKIVNELEQSMRWASQPRFKLEAGMLQMIKMDSVVRIDELLKQIDDLKKKFDGTLSPASLTEGQSDLDKSQREVKIVGTVSAGPLRSAVASSSRTTRVSEPFPSRSLNTTATAYSSKVAATPGANAELRPNIQRISVQEAYARWQDWVAEVSKVKIGIGTILGQTRILDVRNGMLQIACSDEFHLSSLKRHKEFLAESFQKVAGVNVPIEPVLQHSTGTSYADQRQAVESRGESTATKTQSNNPSIDGHPVLAALRRELGAEPVSQHNSPRY